MSKAARDRTDPTQLEGALDTIAAWHVERATGATESLNPGATAAEITAAFERLAIRPTGELRTLWAWHDGGTGSVPVVWYHDLLSADEAVREYRRLRRNPLVRWDERFVPVWTFEGEWYAVYCGPDGLPAGPVVHYFLEDGPRVSFTNLTTMMVTMADAFESGAITWNGHTGAMVENIGALARIHATHNPGTEFPYRVD